MSTHRDSRTREALARAGDETDHIEGKLAAFGRFGRTVRDMQPVGPETSNPVARTAGGGTVATGESTSIREPGSDTVVGPDEFGDQFRFDRREPL